MLIRFGLLFLWLFPILASVVSCRLDDSSLKGYLGPDSTENSPGSPGTSINQSPLANTDIFYVDENSSIPSITALNNDNDPDGEIISLISYTQSANGTVSDNGNGTLSYTPTPGFFGQDSFTYTIADEQGAQATATVQLFVMTPSSWTGNQGDKKWTSPGNWCGLVKPDHSGCAGGSTFPGASDIATFTGNCTNCDLIIDGSINVAGIVINSSYEGVITQASAGAQTEVITVGSAGWLQKGGEFVGGDATIDISGNFFLEGGSFTSTQGELIIGQLVSTSIEFFKQTAGSVYNHNNGTIVFDGYSGCSTQNLTMDVPTSINFYNVRIQGDLGGTGGCSTAWVTAQGPKLGDYVVVENDLVHDDGKLYGVWHLKGNYIVNIWADGTHSNDLHRIIFNGTGNQTYSFPNGTGIPGYGYGIEIDKTSGTVEPAAGTVSLHVPFLIVNQGSFTAPSGELVIMAALPDFSRTNEIFTVKSGTAFNYNSTTFKIDSTLANHGGCNPYYEMDLPVGFVFESLDLNFTTCGAWPFQLGSKTGTVEISGDFQFRGGFIHGEWFTAGNFLISSQYATTKPGSHINLNGLSPQQISIADVSYSHNGGIGGFIFNNPTTVTLQGSVNNFNFDLEVKTGTFDLAGFDFLNIDALNMSGGAVLKNGGSINYSSCSGVPCPP